MLVVFMNGDPFQITESHNQFSPQARLIQSFSEQDLCQLARGTW